MSSRFVNLAVRHVSGRVAPFSLYRINPAKLFYPTGGTVSTAATSEGSPDPAKIRKAPLPRPAISFDWPYQKERARLVGWMEFVSVGPSRNAFFAVDSAGGTIFYDAELNMVRNRMPMTLKPIRDPVAITVGDELYMMNGNRRPWTPTDSFQALVHDTESSVTSWYWRSLQPPPIIAPPCADGHHSRGCDCYYDDTEDEPRAFLDDEPQAFLDDEEDASEICAHTVVGDSQIWISTAGAGTYCFDTESDTWSKAGDWALPFRGRAEYVPEYGLWFGFSHDHKQLCAFDMSSVSAAAPVPLMAWDDLAWPESWVPTETRLVPLGSGRFCIARFFYTLVDVVMRYKYMNGHTDHLETMSNFAVLTGVEVERGGAQGLGRMVRHKSTRYVFGCDRAKPV